MGLQNEIIRRLGRDMNMRMHHSVGAIAVAGNYGNAGRNEVFNLLLRDQAGWTSWGSGRPRMVAPAVAAELDRLLKGDNFWREDGFVYGQPCPGKGRVMQVLYRGRDKLSRQLCGPQGIAGRLADLAAMERVPAGAAPSEGGRQEMIRATRGSDYDGEHPAPDDPDAAGLVLFLTSQSVYALRDGRVEDHVRDYADDVRMAWPGGTETGKQALRRRARSPAWNGVEPRHLQLGEASLRQTGNNSFIIAGTYKFWDGSRESDIPVTTKWQKRRGIWQITQQQIGSARSTSAVSDASQPKL
jgi:hypothetical protein